MFGGLSFGWRTAILLVAFIQMLVIAAALARTIENRVANRTLALLLVVLAGITTPWMIGFAGFYDKWELTFLPVSITLAVGPLLYFHVHALVGGRWPQRWRLHLAPPAAQFALLTGSFLLPPAIKQRWVETMGETDNIVIGAGTLIGLAAYGWACLTLLARYRRFLAGSRSDDHRFASRWLSRLIGAMLVLLPIWAAYLIADRVAGLGYRGLMGLYVAIAAFGVFLAIEGWRHASRPFPLMVEPTPEPVTPPRDWRALGEGWAAQVRAEGWAADPALSLALLARRLGTNTGHLSRALNEGLGQNFSAFVNGLRCEAVAAEIREGRRDDLLDLALEAGFSSKASFNRAFVQRYGMAPSAYRRAHGSKHE